MSENAPLRIGIRTNETADEALRDALTWMLGRRANELEVVPASEAEVTVGVGESDADIVLRSGGTFDYPDTLKKAKSWHHGDNSAAPDFDLLWLIDFVLRGGEESSDALDAHGRFDFRESLLYKEGLLEQPFLDQLADKFLRQIFAKAGRSLPPPKWYYCPTLDIDSAGMFRNGGALRTTKRFLRERPGAILKYLEYAITSLVNPNGDPHLSVRMIGEMLEGLGVPVTIFTQVVKAHRLDNYDLKHRRTLLAQLHAVLDNEYHEIGLHSSYATRDRGGDFFQEQFALLNELLDGKAAQIHRAHYLRTLEGMDYQLPEGEQLIDSSLGYGGHEGFRRGTAFPFRLGNGLIEIAPAAMDTQLRYHRGMTPEQAFETVCAQMDAVSKTGGALVMIHHPNEMDDLLSPGWGDLLIDLVHEAKRRGGVCTSLAPATRSLHDPVQRFESRFRECF